MCKEQLMSKVWYPTRWLDWCMSEDEKEEVDPMLLKMRKKK